MLKRGALLLVSSTSVLLACGSDPAPPVIAVPPSPPTASVTIASPPPPPPAPASATAAVAQTADPIGDAFGDGGLGLSGVGEGAGGRGEGISVGSPTRGQGLGGRRGPPPNIRQGAVQVNGRLPPEVIERIVRQNFGRFRLCYELGLKSNAKLEGRVNAKFVIDQAGAVKSSGDGGSNLPDKDTVACVVRAFTGLSFPQPEGGIVTVIYPLIFAPPS